MFVAQKFQINHSNAPSPREDQVVWFALSAPYRNERRAKSYLESKGIETFLPMRYEIVKNRYGGKTKELVPAVSNLLFARTTKSMLQQVKTGIKYLQYKVKPEGNKNTPIIVPNNQMEQFMNVCKNNYKWFCYYGKKNL